jgi:hypothetical protein
MEGGGQPRQRFQVDEDDPALVEVRDAQHERQQRLEARLETRRDIQRVHEVLGNSTGNRDFRDVASTVIAMPPDTDELTGSWMPYMQPFTPAQADEFSREGFEVRNVRGHQQMLRAQFPTIGPAKGWPRSQMRAACTWRRTGGLNQFSALRLKPRCVITCCPRADTRC